MANIMFGLTVFVLAFNAALAINCYSCDSSKGMTCNYGFLSFTYNSEDCSASQSDGILSSIASIIPKKCYKLYGKDKEGNEFVSRGCVPSTGIFDSCSALARLVKFVESSQLQQLECSTCDTDKCNSAPKAAGITFVTLLLASLVFLL